ncbi:hypothetical protein, partial [Virgibacillus dokdonensis]|uniref:hypothetical protein n=1 Tax=Virgibacillus dokdonensis TaxID=302167 RepID=UPI001C6EDFA6
KKTSLRNYAFKALLVTCPYRAESNHPLNGWSVIDIAFHNSSITNYTFVMSLIIEDEKVEFHGIAFDMLVNPLCHIDGAYYTALYHAKRCVELTNQQDVGYLTNLLFLHDVPETVVSEKEAFNVAKKILTLDPNNEIANEFMSENRNNK